MSPLSPVKINQAEGPAFCHALLRLGNIVLSKLRGPLVHKFILCAMHRQTNNVWSVISESSGKPPLQMLGWPFLQHDFKGLRSPVSKFTIG